MSLDASLSSEKPKGRSLIDPFSNQPSLLEDAVDAASSRVGNVTSKNPFFVHCSTTTTSKIASRNPFTDGHAPLTVSTRDLPENPFGLTSDEEDEFYDAVSDLGELSSEDHSFSTTSTAVSRITSHVSTHFPTKPRRNPFTEQPDDAISDEEGFEILDEALLDLPPIVDQKSRPAEEHLVSIQRIFDELTIQVSLESAFLSCYQEKQEELFYHISALHEMHNQLLISKRPLRDFFKKDPYKIVHRHYTNAIRIFDENMSIILRRKFNPLSQDIHDYLASVYDLSSIDTSQQREILLQLIDFKNQLESFISVDFGKITALDLPPLDHLSQLRRNITDTILKLETLISQSPKIVRTEGFTASAQGRILDPIRRECDQRLQAWRRAIEPSFSLGHELALRDTKDTAAIAARCDDPLALTARAQANHLRVSAGEGSLNAAAALFLLAEARPGAAQALEKAARLDSVSHAYRVADALEALAQGNHHPLRAFVEEFSKES